MHFAANEAPILYSYQLWRLFKHFSVPVKGIFGLAAKDVYERKFKYYLHHRFMHFRRVFQ
jgi:hypothetical protein